MKFVRYPQLSHLSQTSCVTIGNFDGVHLGHQALVAEVVDKAKSSGQLAVVVTMQPLPQQFFSGSDTVELLTSFKLKFQLLENLGVDIICCLNFNQQLASMSADLFYQQVLIQGLNAEYILVGDDFRFGADRKGDFSALQRLSHQSQVSVRQMQPVTQSGQRVSSTLIRQYLKDGNLAAASTMLGRHFNIIGRVAHGKKLGRSLGYPTINIELKQRAFPLHGIYVVSLILAGISYPAVASVGFNPSVGGNAKRVEVYVLDFNQQVYGQCVEVLFYKKLRNEVEFDSLAALTSAIEQDVYQTREFFANQSGELV